MAALLVKDYEEALAFFVGRLGFVKQADMPQGGGKRWVAVFEDLYGNRWDLIGPSPDPPSQPGTGTGAE